LFCDLDRFKVLNDTYGHATGDRVLEIVADRLQELSRETDTVARNGGDEFVVVLEDLDDERQATRIAERLRSTLAQPIVIGDEELRVDCSVGAVIVMPSANVAVDSLVDRADAAMYLAKRGGGNQAVTILSGSSDLSHREDDRRADQPAVRHRDKLQCVDVPAPAADLCLLDLEPLPASVGVARRALERWARQVDAGSVIEAAKLLVSELATNAVTHARTPYTVRARWRPPYLRVEVMDFAPPPRATSRADQLGGWGFEFLDRLSHAWGIHDRGDSKVTWFDVKEPAGATPESSQARCDSSTAESRS
jgi:diguanylate cyclase (GGDEF)-like protein